MKRTGKYAYVDGVPCTVSWQFGQTSSATRYSASCSPDASVAVAGNIDQTGTITGMGYLPFLPQEDDFDFIGVASAKVGEIINYEGPIKVTESTLNIPVSDGGPITWTSTFGVQGQLAKTTTPAYEDDTRSPAPSAKDGAVKIETTPATFDPVPFLQSISVVFRRPANTLVDAGLTYRETGNLEVDLSFEVKNDDFDLAMYATNTIKRVRVFVTPALYYEFDAFLFKDKTNYNVTRVGGELIGYSVNAFWTALKAQATPVLGYIKKPDGSYLYGGP